MTRTVQDQAVLLDVMVGYDPEDPSTALGVGQAPDTYARFLDAAGLRGARIGRHARPTDTMANRVVHKPPAAPHAEMRDPMETNPRLAFSFK